MLCGWKEQAAIQQASLRWAEKKAQALERLMLQSSLQAWHSLAQERQQQLIIVQRVSLRASQNRHVPTSPA